jgi:hypothetical protein
VARLALLLALLAAPALAAEGEGAGEEVPLDRLLTLPSAPPEVRVEKRGGSTKAQWQARFEAARGELEEARRALEETRAELEEASADSDAWRMSAPGLGSTEAGDAPLDYKLSQDLRRQREEVARLERRLQDLEVEANLAGVPTDWRGGGESEADASATDGAPRADAPTGAGAAPAPAR